MFRTMVLALLCLGLVGCDEAPATTPVPAAPGPGPELIDPERAGAFFATACVETRPSFDGLADALAGEPLYQSTSTGTYFHQKYDLSFNANAERCSMVFRGSTDVTSVVGGTALGAASVVPAGELPRNIDVTSRPSPLDPDRFRYYRMVMPGQT